MSKSYHKKIRMHIAYGNNTDYYRSRRRRNRRANRITLRTTVTKNEVQDVDDVLVLKEIPKRDTWNEPTDGSWVETAETINQKIIDRNYDRGYMQFIKKQCRGLKWRKRIFGMR